MIEVIQKIKIKNFNITNKNNNLKLLRLYLFAFIFYNFGNSFNIKAEDLIETNAQSKNSISSTYKIGLAFQYNFLRNSLGFSEFTSTNRPDIKFNNYNDRFLSPKLYLEYFYRDYMALGLNFSYNNMSYSDKLNEEFLVSNQGTPTLATIQTITNAKINTFNISPKVLLNYENFLFETSMNVFFCLNQI